MVFLLGHRHKDASSPHYHAGHLPDDKKRPDPISLLRLAGELDVRHRWLPPIGDKEARPEGEKFN